MEAVEQCTGCGLRLREEPIRMADHEMTQRGLQIEPDEQMTFTRIAIRDRRGSANDACNDSER